MKIVKENPYSKLIELMRPGNPATGGIVIGQVTSASPLTVTVGELPLDAEDLLIADHLLEGYQRAYSTNRLIPNGSNIGNFTFTDGLEVGDRLAMVPTADKQLYIVLARVRGL